MSANIDLTEIFLRRSSNWLALSENKHYLPIQANSKETTLQQSQQSFHLWKMQVILKMKEYLLEIHTLEFVFICVWSLHEVTAGNILLWIFCCVLTIKKCVNTSQCCFSSYTKKIFVVDILRMPVQKTSSLGLLSMSVFVWLRFFWLS